MATTNTLRGTVLEMARKSGMSEADIDLLKPSILKQRDAFAVLLFRKSGAMAVSPDVRNQLSESLDGHGIKMLAVDVEVNPDACATLEVTSSTPKLVFFGRRTHSVTPPAWLVDPGRDEQHSAMEAWISGFAVVPRAPRNLAAPRGTLQRPVAAGIADFSSCAEGSSQDN